MIEIVASGGLTDRDWQVDGDPSAVTVGEVAAALGLPPTEGPVLVDDRAIGRRTTLAEAGVARGARFRLPTSGADHPPAEAAGHLHHVAGLGAGRTVALPRGRHLVGRSLAGPPGVAAGLVGPSAVPVDVEAGTAERWIELPGAVFRVDGAAPPPPRRRLPDERGLIPVHRPPRPPAPAPVAAPDAPPMPDAPRPPAPLSWVTVLGPLPVVIAMALLFSPRFALLGLAGPLLAVGRWAEGRARLHRERRRFEQALAAGQAEHLAALRLAADAERSRRWQLAPGPDAVRRAVVADLPLVWERRGAHDDALALALGATAEAWPPDPRAASTRLGPVPYVVPLAERRAIGVVGEPGAAVAVVRWLAAAAAVHHGPADLALAALLDPADRDGEDTWSWLKWLPHVEDHTGQRRLAATADEAGAVVGSLVEELGPVTTGRVNPAGQRPTRFGLLVVARAELARARAVREQLTRHGTAVRAIVMAERVDDLPAWCDVVVDVDGSGTARVTDGGVVTEGIVVTGVDRRWVDDVARGVARLDDPEHHRAGGEVPTAVGLVDVLGLERDVDDLERLAGAVARRWDGGRGLAVPVGADGAGPFVLDLVTDGPHALVAGTTGAGKSELLRSWVAAMASSASPDDVNLILVDFKGGGAFDACAELPHTVAVVTDLDAHLAARALRCLRAEVRYRESLLRDAGASDIDQYRSAGTGDPLPRLVVVVDEFATLAAELPDFLTSIVDIAQRGRSLGIHLVLATQRPSGVVDNKVRANTNLRVALRVQDDADSHDVVGCGDAARLSRRTPGRALARLGSGDVRAFQAALVSASSRAAPTVDSLAVRPFTLWGDEPTTLVVPPPSQDDGTDLERLAAAARLAARQRGCRPPRVPWPAPLPASLDAVDVWAGDRPEPGTVAFGLADEPDLQRQTIRRWRVADGNLLVLGANGADTTRVLTTLAVGLADGHRVDDAHLYVVDGGSGGLAPLATLPHCGAYASGGDTARSARILEVLAGELDARRAATRQRGLEGRGGPDADRPLVVLLVENAGAVLDALDADGERDALAHLAALVRDGASLGIHTVLAVPHERALPGRLAGLVPQRLVLRMADTTSYLALGLPARELPALAGLRAVATPDGTEVQVAEVVDAPAAVQAIAAQCTTPPIRPPLGVRTLGRRVALADVDAGGRIDADGWTLPIAVTPSYRAVALELPPGIHAIVVGGPGSGRSSTLLALAHAARAAGGDELRLVVVTPRRSPLTLLGTDAVTATDADSLEAACAEAGDRPVLVLVDDADLVAAPLGAALARLAETPHDHRRIVVAGRPDTLRSATGWVAALRHGRTGIALQPAPGDGDVFRTALPLRLGVPPSPGRGYVITLGTAQLAQIALPPSAPTTERHR